MSLNMPLHKKTAGFTLLEVMIAFLIFSVGLLGLAGMQGIGMRNNQIAYSRTIASQLAYDMADRIRNNPNVDYATIAASSATNCITASGGCNAAQTAAFDKYEWNTAITNAGTSIGTDKSPLNNAAGFITANGTGFRIAIGWDENGAGTVTSCNPPTPTGSMCITVDIEP